MPERDDRLAQLEFHAAEAHRLRRELDSGPAVDWRPPGFYTLYHLMAGITLGGIAAAVSLLWNVLGATLMLPGEHPLRIIQVYLSFGMGEEALKLEPGTNRGLLLFAGSILYLATGALFGIVLQFILQGLFGRTGAMVKGLVCAAFGAGLWALNFQIILRGCNLSHSVATGLPSRRRGTSACPRTWFLLCPTSSSRPGAASIPPANSRRNRSRDRVENVVLINHCCCWMNS